MTPVDTAKPPRRIVVAASLRNKDARFGDEPTPSSEARTDRKMPTFGTRLGPSHTFLGHPYTPTQAGKGDLVGSAAEQLVTALYQAVDGWVAALD